MIVGFNHNITYRGVGFHVQTEDSGHQKPQLVTLLYHGGTIISSQKTVYADIIKVDNLEQVVEELAKEQHKGMLKKLTKGEFDQRIVELGIPLGASATQSSLSVADQGNIPQPPAASDAEALVEGAEPVTIVEEPIIDKFRQPKATEEPSLDDLIYAYLTAGQKQEL
ncbi:MAG: hypothetical protein OQK50_05465 [Deltaproteobacteria bacterium]|jgi:hypothetical protein|nr:hypothetical protein [Deltaproteobacteria bacterium]MCW9049762.1 hypothetical protein [Deltaproteobacteria bacterium]